MLRHSLRCLLTAPQGFCADSALVLWLIESLGLPPLYLSIGSRDLPVQSPYFSSVSSGTLF